MDTNSIFMLIIMIILISISAFFSATETAFSSFNRIKMKTLAASDNKKAEYILKLDDNYDILITTILIGNNIANIVLTTVGTLFFINTLNNISKDAAASISTIVITIAVLIFGEVSPKTIAKDHADGYALATCKLVSVIIRLLYPITYVFIMWRKLLCKVFKSPEEDITTEDDLITMVDEASKDGELNEDESELIRSAIEFSDLTAGEILTPRIDIIAVDEKTDPREIMMLFFDTGLSRLPIIGDSIDDIKGVLHEKDFFHAYFSGKSDLSEYYQKPFFVSEHEKIDELLRDFQKEKCHMAFVVDEFGGIAGIVTMEDVIEELIGDVWDEHDMVETLITKNTDGSYTVDCSAEIDDLFDIFEIRPDNFENEMPQTVNGWLQMMFEGLPEKGDVFEYLGLSFTIIDCDEKMIKTVNVKNTI